MYTLRAIRKPSKFDEVKFLKGTDELFDVKQFSIFSKFQSKAPIVQQTIFDVDEIGDYGMYELGKDHYAVASDKLVYSSRDNVLYDFYSYEVRGFCINNRDFIYDCDMVNEYLGNNINRPLNNWNDSSKKYIDVLGYMGCNLHSGIVIEQKAPHLSTIDSYGQNNNNGFIRIIIFKNYFDQEFQIIIKTNLTDEFRTKIPNLTKDSKIAPEEVQMLIIFLRDLIVASHLPINIEVVIKRLQEFIILMKKENIFGQGILNPEELSKTFKSIKDGDKSTIGNALKDYEVSRKTIKEENELIYSKPHIDLADWAFRSKRSGDLLPNEVKEKILEKYRKKDSAN